MKQFLPLLGSLILLGYLCQGQDTDGCSLPEVKEAQVESGLRELQFLAPVTDGQRVSRCLGKGPPTCGPEETQEVADIYCTGVGFQFAYFWRATTLNNTDCHPKVLSVDGNVCNNKKLNGVCQGFETITCAGPKVVRGFLEVGVGFGTFVFAQNGNNAAVQMNITLEGLPDAELDFALHQNSVLEDCESTGREIKCNGERGCGDLSGRLGKLKGPDIDLTMEDESIDLFGEDSVDGRSLVIFDTRGRRIACGTIKTGGNISIPDKLKSDIAESDFRRTNSNSDREDDQQGAINTFGEVDDFNQGLSPSDQNPSEIPFLESTDAFAQSPFSAIDSLDASLPSSFFPSAPIGSPEVASRCPIGKTCQIRKCRTGCDGLQTCCRCQKWFVSDGMCAPDSWIKIGGPGDCTFNSDCPPGVVCIGVKRLKSFNGADFDETCCECLRHKSDGTCEPDAFQIVSGSGSCNFELEGDAEDGLNITGAQAQGE